MPSLTSLAEEILANAKLLDEHLVDQKQPIPSFDNDTLTDLSPKMESARDTLINSTHTLKLLTQGPVQAIIDILFNWTDLLSLRAVYAYKLPLAVPIDGEATYQEIASASGISESMAHRYLRHAMANHIFAESAPNKVCHTAASRLMLTDSDFFDAIGLETCEFGPAAGSVLDAYSKYGDSGEPNENAYSLSNGTDLGFYQFLAQHPERARRFGAAMRFLTRNEGWHSKHLVAGFDWPSIDYPGATVVDIEEATDSILRNLIPSLDAGTGILIYEVVLSDDPETRLTEKLGLNLDINMAAFFNAAQRTRAQWVGLLKEADGRFVVQNIVRPEGSSMSVIEVVWKAS